MDLSRSWAYIEEIARLRLEHNKTVRHVSDYGEDIEIMGVAGELAARRFMGLPEKLHTYFDGGADMRIGDRTVDVKSTHMTPKLYYRFLQWPEKKLVKSEIILMTAVCLENKTATVIGFATRNEVLAAPVNYQRSYPCREIPISKLHPAWELMVQHNFPKQAVFGDVYV